MTATCLAQEPAWDGNTVILGSKKSSDNVFAVISQDAEEMAAKPCQLPQLLNLLLEK